MVKKTKEESDRTFHALLDAAVRLFHNKGVAETTLNDIAGEVRMTRGAVYWHFQNKDDIIIELWKRDGENLHKALVNGLNLSNAEDPVAQFRQAVQDCIVPLVDEPNLYQVIRVMFNALEMVEKEGDLQKFLRQTGARFYDEFHTAFEYLAKYNLLNPKLNAKLATSGLWSYMHGIVKMSGSDGMKKINLSEDAEILLDIYLDAVLNLEQ